MHFLNRYQGLSAHIFSYFKDFFSDIFSYFHIKIYSLTLLIINCLIWIFVFYIISLTASEHIFLHYNVDFGVNLIGQAKNLYLIPSLGLAIAIINIFLYKSISQHRDRIFISHALFAGALAANIILLISTATIYLVNFQ